MFQFFQNYSGLLIPLLIILAPTLAKLGEWFLKQKARRDLQAEIRRREEEELRTGRISTPERPKAPTPEEVEAMIAEQMRQQHEEMLRQRAEQAEARRRAARERAKAARQVEQPQGAQLSSRQQAALAGKVSIARKASITDIVPAGQIATSGAARRTSTLVGEVDTDALRKAVVMSEILSPPLALREPGDTLF